MKKILRFPDNIPPAPPQLVTPATSHLLVDALNDRVERDRIVQKIVDVSRELADRQSRSEYWTETIERFRDRCRAEGAATADIARGMNALHKDVGIENERRSQMARELAAWNPLFGGFTPEVPAPSGIVLAFPGDPPVDQLEASTPKLKVET